MSAFLVSHEHIDAMVKAMGRYRIIPNNPQAMKATGRVLLAANLKSLTARYGKDHGFHDKKSDAAYIVTYGPMKASTYQHITHATNVKLADCFAYQSCEYDAYPRSKAHKLVDQLKSIAGIAATRETDTYNNAPWGL